MRRSVNGADTMSPPRSELPKELAVALRKNRARRERVATELEASRRELQELLVRGDAPGVIAEMARVAGISRETAYVLLRDAGRLAPASRREKEAKDDA